MASKMFDDLLFTLSVGKAENMALDTEQMRLPALYESQVPAALGGGPHTCSTCPPPRATLREKMKEPKLWEEAL